jgi:hypothetical protein
MSVDPGAYDETDPLDPQDAVLDPDDEAERTYVPESLDYLDPGDPTQDRTASIYDTSYVPLDRPPQHNDFGTTLAEMREGESLDMRLSEDEPDVLERELGDPVDQVVAATGIGRGPDPAEQGETGDALLATEADDDPAVQEALAAEGGDTDFPAAEFAEQEPRAGRLVEPDQGVHTDTEKDMIAQDVGISGGAASAEEAAVHVVDEP